MNGLFEHHQRQSERCRRAAAVWISVLLTTFVVLFARVAQLKIEPSPLLAVTAGSPYSTRLELARRGDLLDREGRMIATSCIGYRLFVDPQEVEDLQTIAVDLAHLTGGDPIEYDRKIIKRERTRYVVLEHLLTDGQIDAIRRTRLRGVGLEPRLVREYTSDDTARIVVGKVGFEHTGQGGMELRFNDRLTPSNGRLTYLRDSGGSPLWIDPAGYQPRHDGDDVRLSIDLVIQEIAERKLRESVEQYNAGGGRLVVLDVGTGEILALCDILRPRTGWDEVTDDPNRLIHPSLGRNRCATDPYEPGSTFKPFIWSLATEWGHARLDEILSTPSEPAYRTSRGRRIRDSHYYGPSSWEKVLIKSMNSGMAIVAERLTPWEMQEALMRFGFGQRTGAGLPGESAGLVTLPKNWNHYTQTSVSMGHEVGVTPLQMVQAFSAFARDGTMPDLRLTAVADAEPRAPIVRRALSPEIALLTRRILRRVMTEGTGRKSQSEQYQLFGKSGTAQLPKKGGGGYYENRYVSSFIAGAPLEHPRLIVLCVIDDPDRKISHWGGEVAGPVVRDVMDEALGYLGVAPDIPAGE